MCAEKTSNNLSQFNKLPNKTTGCRWLAHALRSIIYLNRIIQLKWWKKNRESKWVRAYELKVINTQIIKINKYYLNKKA